MIKLKKVRYDLTRARAVGLEYRVFRKFLISNRHFYRLKFFDYYD